MARKTLNGRSVKLTA